MDDIEAIKQLSSRYNLAFDYGDVEAYLGCWTEDGFFERSNAGRSYQGHDQLRELITTFPVDGRHLTTNFIIEVDGDSARQSAYLAYLDKADGFAVNMFGVYADEIARDEDGWKYASRRLQVDLP
jgi:ketosteroid isomerase-like protein